MRVLVARGRRVGLLLVRERSRGLLVHVGFRAAAIRAKDKSGLPVKLGRWCATIANSPDISGGIAPRDRDPRVSGQRSPSSCRTGEDTVYSFKARYRLERPDYVPRQRTRPTGRDVRGSGACLRHHTTG